MPRHVRPYLLTILRRAVTLGADEVRFATGQLPAFKLSERLLSAAEAPIRGEVVQALHEECLSEAERDDLSPNAAATYEFSFPGIGTFSCEFQLDEASRSLRIAPTPGQTSVVNGRSHKPRASSSVVEPGVREEARNTQHPPSEA